MTPRETIANTVLVALPTLREASVLADAILAALAEAGYTICYEIVPGRGRFIPVELGENP